VNKLIKEYQKNSINNLHVKEADVSRCQRKEQYVSRYKANIIFYAVVERIKESSKIYPRSLQQRRKTK
jgi:hypothetical protein